MKHKALWLISILLLSGSAFAAGDAVERVSSLDSAQRAYDASDYPKAILSLQTALDTEPQSAEIQFLLAKSYYELDQYNAAVDSAEKAVAAEPESSLYHEWLGRAYGAKAEHASWFSALSFAKKTRKEFEKAVSIDNKNFAATQALIEFDCAAPAIAGGGMDKAQQEIQQLAAIDPAEGYYASGNCARQKKDFDSADAEFTKALQGGLKSADLIYDIGDYAIKRNQPERLVAVADAGEKVAPTDPRGKFYRAVAFILNRQKSNLAARLLSEYLQEAPTRTGFPRAAAVHYWFGRRLENENQSAAAMDEYAEAVRLDPTNRMAQESLKKLRKA